MVYKLIFTDRTKQDYYGILNYLVENWGTSSAQKFREKLRKRLKRISNMPTSGTIHFIDGKAYREMPVTKQNTLIYSIGNWEVTILKIFDTRQHPDKRYNF
jgi:plasmid stabilization system protein ParE